MYESLTHFLKTFSAEAPLFWALLVMVIIASAGLLLYGFWEIVLRAVALTLGSGNGARGTGQGGQ